MVDGVSSVGSMEFRMDAWGVDIAVPAARRASCCPPVWRLSDQPKALAAMETAQLPRTFFDFRDMRKSYAAGGYPYTPAVGLINGLNHVRRLLQGRRAGTCLCPPSPHRRRRAPGDCRLGHETLCRVG
jgi:alanine-glyoxylate transaminase/serine-glyoxylate transaminase/serine-pyruvate transaminase